jgi:rSAM-associated Gly-rich repeat protein
MNNRISYVGFLAALSMLTVAELPASAASPADQATAVEATNSIEGRISRLSKVLQERAQQLPTEATAGADNLIAIGFADGAGRGWTDTRRGGWADGHGGDFLNRNPWRNGWSDGGGFVNWSDWGDY